jgi:NAD-dependent SIR2 family protein deacetylase
LASDYQRCAELISEADGLLITAGAGIGIDSGLPDFRGPQGFWGAYPALGRARLAFEQIANPAAFKARPRLAWGFYGRPRRRVPRIDPSPAVLRRLPWQYPGG